jgi:hypothetical protein
MMIDMDDIDRIESLFRAFGIIVRPCRVSPDPPPLIHMELLMTDDQRAQMDAILTEMLARLGRLDEAGNVIEVGHRTSKPEE